MIEPGDGLTLLDRIERYLEMYGLAPTKFGKLAVKTPSLVNRLREGKRIRRTTIERIETFLAIPRAAPAPVTTRRPMTLAQYKAHRYRKAIARNIRDDLAERERRLRDPHEHAATHLRSRGWKVFRTEWENEHGETVRGWFVGAMRKEDAELQAMAFRHGWRG